MLYYAYRVCARRTFARDQRKLFAACPITARALRKAAAKGDDVARRAYADLAAEYGLEGMAVFVRECLTCVRPKWLGPDKAKKRAKKRAKKWADR